MPDEPAPADAVAAADPPWPAGGPSQEEFVSRVRRAGAEHYRELPWRGLDDAWAVLVSEVMLQQTQVARVTGFWQRFMAAFPTSDALASAGTSDVLAMWQGLGYNRRALALKAAADICARDFAGMLPESYEGLLALPGVGPATAAGVTAFARQKPCVYLETNVRTVFLHELFPDREGVADKELVPLVAATCPSRDPRSWYYALLDYGAHLKATTANPSRRSAHHVRQSAFEGSRRQKRAWMVRQVLAAGEAGVVCDKLHERLNAHERAAGRDGVAVEEFASIAADLVGEGFFSHVDSRLRA